MAQKRQTKKIHRNMAGHVKALPKTVPVEEGPYRPLVYLFVAAPFLVGLFYEWMSCLAGLYLLGYLFYCYHKNQGLCIPKSSALLAAAVIVLAYGVTAFWGVDHGMALLGFVKFLPLPLFALAAAQLEPSKRLAMLQTLPLTGTVMTGISFLLGLIPALNGFFLVNQRLAGFFQYPNTFALYLLLGIAVLITSEHWGVRQVIYLVILLLGIFLTGSRTVFVLLLVTVIVSFFLIKNRNLRFTLIGLLLLLLAATASYAAMTNQLSTVGRYLTTSISSSTFLGRFLYFKDALPVILTHPFGLGYLGYSFTQGSFQTGVYSLQNIHNELLQFLLDVGWIPTACLIFAGVQGFRRGDKLCRWIILLTAVHCMFDFDLQFVAVGFVLLSALDLAGKGEWILNRRASLPAIGGILGCVCLYFGLASGFYYAGAYRACVAVDPIYTNAWIALLPQAEDAEEMEVIADRILSVNQSVSLAYSAKARAAYAAGDFAEMIANKQRAISLSRYSLTEYLDYFDMLYIGIQLYEQNGDSASAEYCRQRLLEIPEMLAEVLDETSGLAWRITDKPELSLPNEYLAILEQIGYRWQ